LTNKTNIAIYENNQYLPFFDEYSIERFLKKPHQFTFERYNASEKTTLLIDSYAKGLNLTRCTTVLDVAKGLAKVMKTLPEFTKKTKIISEEAQKIRDAYYYTKSPEELIYKQIPQILGHTNIEESSPKKHKEFYTKLSIVIDELTSAYGKMLLEFLNQFKEKFNADSNSFDDIRNSAKEHCKDLDKLTIDKKLIPFLLRVSDTSIKEAESWFIIILHYLGEDIKPDYWSDIDCSIALEKLHDYFEKISDLQKIRYLRNPNTTLEGTKVYFYKSITNNVESYHSVALTAEKIARFNKSYDPIAKLIDKFSTKELKQEFLAYLLGSYSESIYQKSGKDLSPNNHATQIDVNEFQNSLFEKVEK
jgi:hypothetical protein